jgi:hypothetical protein
MRKRAATNDAEGSELSTESRRGLLELSQAWGDNSVGEFD